MKQNNSKSNKNPENFNVKPENRSKKEISKMANIHVQSPNIRYTENTIESDYEYDSVRCVQDSNGLKVSFFCLPA